MFFFIQSYIPTLLDLPVVVCHRNIFYIIQHTSAYKIITITNFNILVFIGVVQSYGIQYDSICFVYIYKLNNIPSLQDINVLLHI